MKVALYQGPSPSGDIEAAFAALEMLLATSAAAKADIAVAPEVFFPGYNAPQIYADPEWPVCLSELARRYETALVVGLAEQEGKALLNAAHAYAADGTLLARYAKRQLYGPREAELFKAGDDLCLFDYRGKRIALFICYDIEFSEQVRACAANGAEVILVPTANMIPFDGVSRFVVPARANENAISIAYANYCGVEGDITYCGHSLIVGPDGEMLAQAGLGETILIAEIPDAGHPQLRPLSTQAKDLRPI